MTVTFCIASLGVIIISSWYSFLWQLATRSERKRRLEKQIENAAPFDSELYYGDFDAA